MQKHPCLDRSFIPAKVASIDRFYQLNATAVNPLEFLTCLKVA